MSTTTLAALAIYGVISALSLGLIIFAAYRLLRRLFTYLFKDMSTGLFGSDAKVRLISLGAATLVFYSVPPRLVYGAGRVLYAFFDAVGGTLFNGWENASAMCAEPNKIVQCASGLLFRFVGAWAAGFKTAYDAVPEDFPYTSLILYLALWATVAYLLGETQVTQGQATVNMIRGRYWVSGAYRRLGWNATLNLLFFLILGLGSYLSIASIIAIPILQDSTAVSDELSVASLKQRLEDKLKDLESNFPEGALADGKPLDRLVAIMGGLKEPATQPAAADAQAVKQGAGAALAPVNVRAGNPEATPTPAAPGAEKANGAGDRSNGAGDRPRDGAGAPEGGVGGGGGPVWENTYSPGMVWLTADELPLRIREDLSKVQSMRQEMFSAWKELRTKSKTSQRNAAANVVSMYEVNLKKKGAGEKGRREYLLSLTQWFETRGESLEDHLRRCQAAINNQDGEMRGWADYAERALRTRTTATTMPLVGYRYYDVGRDLELAELSWRGSCSLAGVPTDVIPASNEGASLGYFRLIAQWLVTTELLPLALITGLLGFGLLGSACSTFIREHEERKSVGDQAALNPAETRLLVSDLTGVIIRGMSAAIVVFLAVEGGLAIFASKGSEPNPYVLLLTCFVGAVFSESVWRWARDKYLQFNDDGGGGGATTNAAATNAAATTGVTNAITGVTNAGAITTGATTVTTRDVADAAGAQAASGTQAATDAAAQAGAAGSQTPGANDSQTAAVTAGPGATTAPPAASAVAGTHAADATAPPAPTADTSHAAPGGTPGVDPTAAAERARATEAGEIVDTPAEVKGEPGGGVGGETKPGE